MDFSKFSEKLALEINAQHTEYDANHSVFIVPLKDDRFQTVIAKVIEHPKFNKKVVNITSKIAYITEQIDFVSLLSASAEFVHTKFMIEDEIVKTEASLFLESVNETIVKEMILEVANTADEWEFKITGKDNF